MDIAIAAVPIIGLYVVVVCYHLASIIGSKWVREAVVATQGTEPLWKMGFIAALLASAVVWFVAVLYAGFNATQALRHTAWKDRQVRVLTAVGLWCVVQPILTTITFPQAMSLLVVKADQDAANFIALFQHTRLPGFVIGLAVAFTLALLVFSLGWPTTKDRVLAVRKALKQGVWIYILLVFLGAVRVAVAQRAVKLVPGSTLDISSVLNVELTVYTIYYSMMALAASYGAFFAFNLQVDRRILAKDSSLRAADAKTLFFGKKDLAVGLASFSPIVLPIVSILKLLLNGDK